MAEKENETFETKVNGIVSTMTQAEDGNWVIPEAAGELDEPTQYAVNSERRRRDTQSSHAKQNDELLATRAERDALAKEWEASGSLNLTAEQSQELEVLKATDPDAWKDKLDGYTTAHATVVKEKRAEISATATKTSELATRQDTLNKFNEENPNIVITDEFIANEVPPKFLKELEAGSVTFSAFLDKVKGFVEAGKVLETGAVVKPEVDLGALGGSTTPSSDAVNRAATESYENETY